MATVKTKLEIHGIFLEYDVHALHLHVHILYWSVLSTVTHLYNDIFFTVYK